MAQKGVPLHSSQKTIFDDLGNIIPEKQYLNIDMEQTRLYFYKNYLWSTEIHQTWQPYVN